MKPFIPPSIPSTIPMKNPKTIQIPSSLVDSSLVSFAVVVSEDYKVCGVYMEVM